MIIQSRLEYQDLRVRAEASTPLRRALRLRVPPRAIYMIEYSLNTLDSTFPLRPRIWPSTLDIDCVEPQ